MDTIERIAGVLGVGYKDLLAETALPQQMKVQVVVQLDVTRIDAVEVAGFITLLGKMLHATHEIIIKDVREGSVIISLDMTREDVVQLVALLPDLSERAREVLRETPEGMAYFRGEESEGAERVRRLLEMVDAVSEVRVSLEEPASIEVQPELPAQESSPEPTPQEPTPEGPPERKRETYLALGIKQLYDELDATKAEPPSPERDERIADIEAAIDALDRYPEK